MPLAPSHLILSGILVGLAVGVNVDSSMLATLGIHQGYLTLTLLAVTFAGLMGHRILLGGVLLMGLAVAVNLPPDLLIQHNIHPEIVFATLLTTLVAPTGLVLLGWQPPIY